MIMKLKKNNQKQIDNKKIETKPVIKEEDSKPKTKEKNNKKNDVFFDSLVY